MRLQVINIYSCSPSQASLILKRISTAVYENVLRHCQRPLILSHMILQGIPLNHSFICSYFLTPVYPYHHLSLLLSRALHLLPCFLHTILPGPHREPSSFPSTPLPSHTFAPSILYTLPCFIFLFTLPYECSVLVHVLPWARTSSLLFTRVISNKVKSFGV